MIVPRVKLKNISLNTCLFFKVLPYNSFGVGEAATMTTQFNSSDGIWMTTTEKAAEGDKIGILGLLGVFSGSAFVVFVCFLLASLVCLGYFQRLITTILDRLQHGQIGETSDNGKNYIEF